MSAYADSQRASGNLINASTDAPNKCDGANPSSSSPNACEANYGSPAQAVHIWNDRKYCAFHSPFEFGEYA